MLLSLLRTIEIMSVSTLFALYGFRLKNVTTKNSYYVNKLKIITCYY